MRVSANVLPFPQLNPGLVLEVPVVSPWSSQSVTGPLSVFVFMLLTHSESAGQEFCRTFLRLGLSDISL